MNAFCSSHLFWIFWGLLLFSACGEMFLNALNTKQMHSKTTAAEYGVEMDRIENAATWIDVLFWGLLFFAGFLPLCASLLEKLIPFTGKTAGGMLFIVVFFLLRFFLHLLPDYWKKILIERKYGYGHSSTTQFFVDQGKRLMLGTVLSAAAAAFLLVFLQKMPDELWKWMLLTFSILLFLWIAEFSMPYLLRLFFHVKDPDDPALGKAAEEILARGGFRMQELKILDFSSRTSHANAFLSGTGCSRKIFLSDTLENLLNRKELLAVIAHETAHGVGRHREKLFAIQAAGLILILLLCYLMMKDFWIFHQFYPEISSSTSVSASTLNSNPDSLPPFSLETEILLCLFVLESTLWILLPLFNLFCRHCEFEADRMASDFCGGPEKLISALRKLLNDPLPEGVHPLYKAFKCRHPSFSEREALLLKLEKRNHGHSPEITGGTRFS